MKLFDTLLLSCTSLFSIVCTANAQYDPKDILSLGLPLLAVQTVNNEEPTCDYLYQSDGYPLSTITNATKVPGRLVFMTERDTLYDSGDYIPDVSGTTINIRGNCSAFESKKSYKLKLQVKKDLLCREDNETDFRDKNWVLLRTDVMYSILNIMVGLKINEMMELPWTPASRYVNLVINGDYKGVYVLAESVRRNADCRLNVDKQTGYIVEYDPYYWKEDTYIESSIPSSLHYTLKYPDSDDITEQQLDDITSSLQEMEKNIFSNNTAEIDIKTFVNWLMAHDILGTQDANGSNIYLMKYDNTQQTKVQMCNLWDFDTITLTEDNWSKVHQPGLFLYYYLIRYNNADFMNAYLSRWEQIKDTLFTSVEEWLDNISTSEESKAIDISLQLEANRYNKNIDTVENVIENFKQWFEHRKSWMDSQLSCPTEMRKDATSRFEHGHFYNLKGIATHSNPSIILHSNKKWICR